MKYIFDFKQWILAVIYMLKLIPQLFFFMTLPVILRIEGHSLVDIGLLQFASFPYVFKFLWAPFLDLRNHRKNHYKKWFIMGVFLYILLLMIISFLDIQKQLFFISVLVLSGSFVISIADLSIDGLYVKLLKFHERGVGSSFKLSFGFIASLISSGVLLYFYKELGWTFSILLMASCLLGSLLLLLFLSETAQKIENGNFFIFKIVFSFLISRKEWIFLVAINSVSAWSLLYILKLLMVDIGVSTKDIASITGIYGVSVATICAILSATPWVQKQILNRKKTYIYATWINAIAVLQVLLFINSKISVLEFYYMIGCLHISTTFLSVISGTIMIDFSRKISQSTDYSFQMATANLAPMGISIISGFIIGAVNYFGFIIFLAILSVLAIFFTHLFANKCFS